MCFDWFKPKPLYPVTSVGKGVMLFDYPDWDKQLDYAKMMGAGRIRMYITQNNYNKDRFKAFFARCRSYNIAPLVLVSNTSNHYSTPRLAGEVASNHANQDNVYLFEIENEPNGEIVPGNTIEPKDYYDIYVRSFDAIRKCRQDTHIFPAGLIGSEKSDIPCTKYVNKLKALGIDKYINDSIRTSGWNFHFYKEMWDKYAKNIVQTVRRSAADRVWVTEYGCPIGDGYENQKKWYDKAIVLCKQYGIEQAFYYALAHGGNPQNPNEDYSLLVGATLSPTAMYHYTASH
jgi:hypothetical protein